MSLFAVVKLHWLLVVLVSCGGNSLAQMKPFRDLIRMYDYDRKGPLQVREVSVEDWGGVKVHDITFAGSGRGRVPAYLVVPAGKGRFAAVIFAHHGGGNRATFLDEALALAKRGTVSLLVDSHAVNRPDYGPVADGPPGGATDRDELIKMVIELRRGLDLLLSRPDVDAKRVGFVGHSIGGRAASILAGSEKRIKAVVVMASQISATEAWRANDNPHIVKLRESLPKEQFERYLEFIAPVDAAYYVSRAAPTALLLQFGRQDDSPNERLARRFYEVASEPKLFKLYEAGHQLNDEARTDRTEWLTTQLKLRSRSSAAEK